MSNLFVVTNCVYDGTTGGNGDPNPLCYISGTVNGKNVFANVFFAYLMAASAAGQMQQALTAIMFNWYAGVYGYQLTPQPQPIPIPAYPVSNVAPTRVFGPYPQPPAVVSQALIGSWSA